MQRSNRIRLHLARTTVKTLSSRDLAEVDGGRKPDGNETSVSYPPGDPRCCHKTDGCVLIG